MKTNQLGIDLIKKFEGFSSKVYLCPAGKPTIGYGHVVKPNENFGTLTLETGENLLKRDLEFFEKQVLKLIQVPVTSNQFSALVSFTYNVGVSAFKNSTLLKRLNAGDYIGAAGQFERWVNGGGKKLKGLVNRRIAEKFLFLTKGE